MKHYIIFLLLFLCCFSGNAQDFNSIMTDMPLSKKTIITDLIKKDSTVIKEHKILTNHNKPNKRIRQENNRIGRSIDSMELIDYKSDTVYVLSKTYWPTSSISLEIKTRRGAFVVMKDYSIIPLMGFYTDKPKEVWNSVSLLYDAIFTWDLDLLTKLIEESGQMLNSEYSMSAMKVIIKNHQVQEKEFVNFEPVVQWHL